MGLKSFKIGRREGLEFACDGIAHCGEPPKAWFDCGSDLGNLALAITGAGWSERRDAEQAWLCPQCARKNALESGYSGARNHADEIAAEKEAA
jgi:hypothetical protein